MVAHFVRLKLTLMRNAFRRSVWQTIGFVIAAIYGLGVVAMLVVAMFGLGTWDVTLAGTVLLLAGTVVTLAWWVVPLFAFGVDATLDPQRFVLLPLPRRRLLLGLAAAGVVSVPGIVTVVAAAGVSLGFWRNVGALVAALLGGALAVALCVVGSRAWTTALAPLIESRRYREVMTVAAFVPLMLFGPAISWLGHQFESSGGDGDAVRAVAEQLAAIAGWTPLGAPWGLADAVLAGSWGLFGARLAIACASVALVWWVWDRALGRALVTPPARGSAGRSEGLGWFDRFPANPTGAIAARSMFYWFRDPRYSASLAIIPLFPIVLYVLGRGAESMEPMLFLGPFIAWMVGYSISADVASDYTAFALHVSSGVSGRADRWGRAIPVLVFGGAVAMLFTVASVWVAGDWTVLPALLGASCGVLLVSVGVSSAVSVRLIYPIAKPGDSPFKQPQGATMVTMIAQMVAMGLVAALCLPVIVLTLVAVLAHAPWAAWAALVVGPVFGIAVLIGGVRIGARTYDRSAPEALAKVAEFA